MPIYNFIFPTSTAQISQILLCVGSNNCTHLLIPHLTASLQWFDAAGWLTGRAPVLQNSAPQTQRFCLWETWTNLEKFPKKWAKHKRRVEVVVYGTVHIVLINWLIGCVGIQHQSVSQQTDIRLASIIRLIDSVTHNHTKTAPSHHAAWRAAKRKQV